MMQMRTRMALTEMIVDNTKDLSVLQYQINEPDAKRFNHTQERACLLHARINL